MPTRRDPPAERSARSISETLSAHLRRHAAFAASELDVFGSHLRPFRLRRGQCLARAAHPLDCIAFVELGCLRTFATDAKGREHTFQFAAEGTWTGDLQSFRHGTPARFTIQALEPAVVQLLSVIAFERAVEELPALERVFRVLFENAYVEAQGRILAGMQEDAATRYGKFLQRFSAVAHRLPDRHIASYLGITPETLSRVRTKRFLPVALRVGGAALS